MQHHHLRAAVPASLAAAALLATAACGTTEDTGGGDETDDAAGPVSTVDARGETVELDAPAETVVTLEWAETEIVASLGTMPAGAADLEGYQTWAGAAVPLDDTVTDVGTRSEPSIDAIAGLAPDLVVMETDDEKLIPQLEEFTAVLVTQGSDAADNIGRMKSDVTMIADLLGKDDEAEALLADFDAKVEEVATAIEAAGTADVPYLFADGWDDGSTISIRPFGAGSLPGALAGAVGLANAWTGETDELWGLGATDVEGMAQFTDTELKFVYNNSFDDDIFNEKLMGNAIWDDLKFVEDGEMYELPHGAWTFGGPRSCELFLDFYAEVYAS
ncbi:ABC transporter substrate-binding protein [Glycomyces arizonensis]|uniref:ABC transporter substrate-binding protein n=1 Tax=Glycomyces arizonensis TaxID=256035 RepID=UPI0003F8CDBD|nr:iron-siderophore ABC transporter substrate-binding protein [Glycomyces arizonensis]